MHKFIICFSAIVMPILAASVGNVNLVQDTLGNYNLKLDTLDASRNEQRFEDGRVIGSFSFVDTNGDKHTVNYVSGAEEGFQAHGDSLPVAPQSVVETPEVMQARAEHLAIVAKEQASFSQVRSVEKPVSIESVLAQLTVPKIASLPNNDVPEVDAEHYGIKAALLKSYAEHLERLALEYRMHQH